MITLYTVVGGYIIKDNKPFVILSNKKECCLDIYELLIWSGLAFQILTYKELKKLFYERQKESQIPETFKFEFYLNRLITRQLIVSGRGETGVDALFDLFGCLTIHYTKEGVLAKCITFFKLFLKGVSFNQCKKIFLTEPLEKIEKNMLQFIKNQSFSTAEILQRYERIESEEKPELYSSLVTIANLYLKKKIRFDI